MIKDVPLSGVQAVNPTLGGYNYLQWTGSVIHPGIDLNSGNSADADWGLPVRSPLRGRVVFVEYWNGAKGFGNHIWLWCPEEGVYLHFCHLDMIDVRYGQEIHRDEILGTCGKSGGWDWAHLHFEVTAAWLGGNYWPVGWSRAEVASVYLDPTTYIRASQPVPSPVSPSMAEDKAIADAVRSLGGNEASPAEWVTIIGEARRVEGLLREEIDSLKNDVAERDATVTDLRTGLAAAAERINTPRQVKRVILVYEDDEQESVNTVSEDRTVSNPNNNPVPLEGTGELIGNPVVDGGRDPKNTDLEAQAVQEESNGNVKADRLQRDTPEEAAHPGEDVEHGSVADGSDSEEDGNLNEADSADGDNTR